MKHSIKSKSNSEHLLYNYSIDLVEVLASGEDNDGYCKSNYYFWELLNTLFWQAFIADLGATIIGVALSIPVALLLNRLIEGITEKKRRTKILRVLYDELRENLNYLVVSLI